jgi:hypothetical protein
MVEEAEGEFSIHGFDPERKSAEFYGERVEVHSVYASFHDMSAKPGLQSGLEPIIFLGTGDHLRPKVFLDLSLLVEQGNEGAPLFD